MYASAANFAASLVTTKSIRQHLLGDVPHHGQGWRAALAECLVQLVCRFYHGFMLLVGLIRTRRAPHLSVPCLTAGWRHLHQAFSDACERCKYLYRHLLGTIVLLPAVLEGGPGLAHDWITANSSCLGLVRAL